MSITLVTLSRYSRLATWVSFIAILLLQAFDAVVRDAPWIIWLVKLGPLLIFLPGMLRDNLRSYIWVSFMSLGYFVLIVQRLFAQPDSDFAIGALVAIVVLFVASMLYVRWRARELRALADAGQSAAASPGDLDE